MSKFISVVFCLMIIIISSSFSLKLSKKKSQDPLSININIVLDDGEKPYIDEYYIHHDHDGYYDENNNAYNTYNNTIYNETDGIYNGNDYPDNSSYFDGQYSYENSTYNNSTEEVSDDQAKYNPYNGYESENQNGGENKFEGSVENDIITGNIGADFENNGLLKKKKSNRIKFWW